MSMLPEEVRIPRLPIDEVGKDDSQRYRNAFIRAVSKFVGGRTYSGVVRGSREKGEHVLKRFEIDQVINIDTGTVGSGVFSNSYYNTITDYIYYRDQDSRELTLPVTGVEKANIIEACLQEGVVPFNMITRVSKISSENWRKGTAANDYNLRTVSAYHTIYSHLTDIVSSWSNLFTIMRKPLALSFDYALDRSFHKQKSKDLSLIKLFKDLAESEHSINATIISIKKEKEDSLAYYQFVAIAGDYGVNYPNVRGLLISLVQDSGRKSYNQTIDAGPDENLGVVPRNKINSSNTSFIPLTDTQYKLLCMLLDSSPQYQIKADQIKANGIKSFKHQLPSINSSFSANRFDLPKFFHLEYNGSNPSQVVWLDKPTHFRRVII